MMRWVPRKAPVATCSFSRSIPSFRRSLLVGDVDIPRRSEFGAHRGEARGLELPVEVRKLALELAPAVEEAREGIARRGGRCDLCGGRLRITAQELGVER